MGWAHLITVNSRYDPWSNWKLSRNVLVPLEMWTEEVFFSECKSFSLPGNSRCPWECDQKGLTSAYQKMVYLPKPDYSYRYHHTAVIKWWFVVILRYSLWKELILSAGGNLSHSDFDLSSLTKISDGWEHFQYLLQNQSPAEKETQKKSFSSNLTWGQFDTTVYKRTPNIVTFLLSKLPKFSKRNIRSDVDRWTSGSICKCVAETLTEKRVLQQKFKHLEVIQHFFILTIMKFLQLQRWLREALI